MIKIKLYVSDKKLDKKTMSEFKKYNNPPMRRLPEVWSIPSLKI